MRHLITTRTRKILTISLFSIVFLHTALPTPIHASCYNWDNPGSLGEIIDCITSTTLIPAIQVIIATIAIIIVLITLYKTFTTLGSANSQKMQELPTRWIFTLLLIFIVAGGGTAILNIFLKLLGVGDINYWIDQFNQIINTLK